MAHARAITAVNRNATTTGYVTGILMEVMAVLSELKITITNINAKVQEDTKNVSINLVVDIRDISQLDFVMTKLRRIREVYTVQRSKGGA